ncbi:MAG TPA: 2-C-methyl-D-erythritol 2,4-cyclodiphosphate synthase [Acidimicrobiaceae bacterium]|nr:2-C-methyl-D-erythritol 2,4-cyclodiphosphate synthase [Acidimicrobiaceae bacterium]|tara:strand:+ start:149 stop:619 length:471 start_codon:yes stop_codon:yes gene_type:complete
MMRIGQGYDAHVWADDDRPLVMGGIHFPEHRGLSGHSDADVVTHAVIDAMLGAAGLGDIGQLFPDTGEEFDGANSIEMLQRVAEMVDKAGWKLANADCTVITDQPQIAPVKDEMERNLSDAAGSIVTVCGKRTEGIGALGRGEGVVAIAVALLESK